MLKKGQDPFMLVSNKSTDLIIIFCNYLVWKLEMS